MSVELFVGLVVIVGVGYWLYTRNSKKDVVTESTTDTPYKVETPVVVQEVTSVVAEATVAAPVAEKPAKAKKASKPKAAKPTAKKAPATKKPKLKAAK